MQAMLTLALSGSARYTCKGLEEVWFQVPLYLQQVSFSIRVSFNIVCIWMQTSRGEVTGDPGT